MVVATLGRVSLGRTLDSFAGQLKDRDEILIVGALSADMDALRAQAPDTPATVRFLQCREPSNHGDAEKNVALEHATGTHLCFIDDDDIYLPGAFEVMRREACDRIVMFRSDGSKLGYGTLWKTPELRYTNVSTQMFVVPNDPARLGRWQPWEPDKGVGTDFGFLMSCDMGDVVWREEVITVMRPDRLTVTVVTPWLNHPELADDYVGAVVPELRQGDDVVIVDNGGAPELPFRSARPQRNLGFSAGSNLGMSLAETDAVLFINNDIAATGRGWLNRIRSALEPGVLVGPVRYDTHADVDGQRFPYIDGWCLAGMRHDLVALGGFPDLEEPAYYSDNILCLNARLAGMTLRDVRVPLVHKESVTSEPQRNPETRRVTVANRAVYVKQIRALTSA